MCRFCEDNELNTVAVKGFSIGIFGHGRLAMFLDRQGGENSLMAVADGDGSYSITQEARAAVAIKYCPMCGRRLS